MFILGVVDAPRWLKSCCVWWQWRVHNYWSSPVKDHNWIGMTSYSGQVIKRSTYWPVGNLSYVVSIHYQQLCSSHQSYRHISHEPLFRLWIYLWPSFITFSHEVKPLLNFCLNNSSKKIITVIGYVQLNRKRKRKCKIIIIRIPVYL